MSTDFEFDFVNDGEGTPFIYNIDFDLILRLNPLNLMTAILYVEYNNAIPKEELVNHSDDVKFRRLDYNSLLSDNSVYVSCSTEYDIEYKNKTILQFRKNGRRKWKIIRVHFDE